MRLGWFWGLFLAGLAGVEVSATPSLDSKALGDWHKSAHEAQATLVLSQSRLKKVLADQRQALFNLLMQIYALQRVSHTQHIYGSQTQPDQQVYLRLLLKRALAKRRENLEGTLSQLEAVEVEREKMQEQLRALGFRSQGLLNAL
jgi:hypothetical protein